MGIFKKQKEVNKTYHLAGNDWYLVAEDDDKMMLVDTDCEVGGDALWTRWCGDWNSADEKNGQCILNYTNDIADTYFGNIKHVIEPRTVEAGSGRRKDAWMWPMSKEEFFSNKVISNKIVKNSISGVWTRTLSGVRERLCFAEHFTDSVNILNSDDAVLCVNSYSHVAPAFYLKKSAIDHITEDGEIVLRSDPLRFSTDGSGTYYLGGNEWYAVMQDDEKVMLVDTDCKIAGKELKTNWTDGFWTNEEGENGQCILNYTNDIADTYFNDIRHAIIPRAVNAGTCNLTNAWMWPMSYEEFDNSKTIGSKIVEKSGDNVWTRSFGGANSAEYRLVWGVKPGAELCRFGVASSLCVAPAFYLKKSAIDHITDDGEIVLQHTEPVQDENDYIPFNLSEELGKLSTETEKLDKMLEESAAERKRKEESFCRKLILAIASMDKSEQELLEKTIDMLIHKIN